MVSRKKISGSEKSSEFEALSRNRFKDVLGRLFEAAGVDSDTALGKVLGIKQQAVAAARKRGRIPTGWIEKVSSKYPVSADWLLHGFGRMRRGPAVVGVNGVRETGICAGRDLSESDSDDLVMVPRVQARLSAGDGSLETSSEVTGRYAFKSVWIRSKGQVNQMVLMDVAGDSMEPGLLDKDVVLVDQSQRDVIPGKIYAVGIDDEIVIKRLDKRPGKIVFISDNKDGYPIYEVDLSTENIRIIGRVVWSARDY